MTNHINRVGQSIGPYRLMQLLAHSDFAQVYLADHLQEQTPVVVKVLSSFLMAEQMNLLRAAVGRLSAVAHPSYLPVLHCGTIDAHPFLVTAYVKGGSLRTRHPKGTRLSLSLVLSYLTQLAPALHYAHDPWQPEARESPAGR